jgi:hypothetical protein
MGLHPDRKRPVLKRLPFDRKRWFLKDYGPGQGWRVGTPMLAAGYVARGRPLRLSPTPLIPGAVQGRNASTDTERITVQ